MLQKLLDDGAIKLSKAGIHELLEKRAEQLREKGESLADRSTTCAGADAIAPTQDQSKCTGSVTRTPSRIDDETAACSDPR